MKKVIRLVFITIVTLMISSCGMSNLSYNNSHITVQVEKEYIKIDGNLLSERRDNFSSLFLNQKILRLKEGNLAVYEEARTALTYEFEPSITKSIQIIFEAKSTIIVYAKSHFYAYQITLKDGRLLNIVAQQSATQQHIRVLYGLSTAQLNKILKQLDPDAEGANCKQVIKIEDEHHAILSKWDIQKVHFVPLVVPSARLIGW